MKLDRRRAVVLGVLWLAACFASTASAAGELVLSREEASDVFHQAKDLFRQANERATLDPLAARDLYRKAAMRLERIEREGGIRNGRLYYNIGNAYFRMDDVGRAILNYRRAEVFTPNDPNLHQNLAYARARSVDRIEPRQRTRVLRTLFFWHYDLSMRARAWGFGAAFVLFWCVLALRLFTRRSAVAWCLGLALVVWGCCLASLLADTVARRTVRPGVVTAAEATARKGDSATYESSFKEPLHAGTEFVLVEDRGDWVHIELADGRRCWVSAPDVELIF